MQPAHAFGTIVPSSNHIVERVTQAIVAECPVVSAHFSRIAVAGEKVHLSDRYDMDGMLTAARLLADARLDILIWNGSKGAGLGLPAERQLCADLEQAAGTPVSTSVLAIDRVFRRTGVARYGLVTPYTADYQAQVARTLAREGYDCLAMARDEVLDNFAIGRITPEAIAALTRSLDRGKLDAVLILCTNLNGAPVVAGLEREMGLPVYDSVSIGVWEALNRVGVDTRHLAPRWGSVFALDSGGAASSATARPSA